VKEVCAFVHLPMQADSGKSLPVFFRQPLEKRGLIKDLFNVHTHYFAALRTAMQCPSSGISRTVFRLSSRFNSARAKDRIQKNGAVA
jgi:hypothetical protein